MDLKNIKKNILFVRMQEHIKELHLSNHFMGSSTKLTLKYYICMCAVRQQN